MEVKSRQVAQCKALRYTYLNICHLLQAVIGVTAYVIYRPMKDFGALVPELPETLDGILLRASVLLHQLAEPEEGCESKGHRDGLDSGVRGDGRCSRGDNNPTWQISISSKPGMQTSKVLSGSAHVCHLR